MGGYLKGLAIVLVVVGHMEYAEGAANPGRMLIYSFHMPLFFMLAGYRPRYPFPIVETFRNLSAGAF